MMAAEPGMIILAKPEVRVLMEKHMAKNMEG